MVTKGVVILLIVAACFVAADLYVIVHFVRKYW